MLCKWLSLNHLQAWLTRVGTNWEVVLSSLQTSVLNKSCSCREKLHNELFIECLANGVWSSANNLLQIDSCKSDASLSEFCRSIMMMSSYKLMFHECTFARKSAWYDPGMRLAGAIHSCCQAQWVPTALQLMKVEMKNMQQKYSSCIPIGYSSPEILQCAVWPGNEIVWTPDPTC